MLRALYYAALGAATIVGALAATPYISEADAGSWSTCHVGALGSWNSVNVEDFLGAEGPGIAATLGCDRQFGDLVVGAAVEYGVRRFDFAGTDVDSKGWAATGRAGVIVFQNTLLYATAGWTQVDAEAMGDSLDLSGAVLGGGVETALGGGLYGRLEYQRLMLEPDDFDVEANVNSFRAGLVYKFGGPDTSVIPSFDAPAAKPLK